MPPAGFRETTQLTILSNDLGNSGLGGPLTDTDLLDISIVDDDSRNNAPINHLLPSVIVEADRIPFNAVSGTALYVTDIDAGNATDFEVSLWVTSGVLVFTGGQNVSFTGNGTLASPFVLTGTLANINSAIEQNLFYVPSGNALSQLTIVSNDRGNSGAGGPLSDTDTMSIQVIDRSIFNQPRSTIYLRPFPPRTAA